MTDGYGRTIEYIRISVTDRCDLRCVYCVPEAGVPAAAREDLLSDEEITELAEVFAGLGIRKIRLTGGEPLMRKGLPSLIKKLKAIPGIEKVALTTNGLLLAESMEELADAGIGGINLSLDTLDPAAFEKITRRRGLERVLEGFHEALKYPEIPLKVNCVPLGWEEQDAPGVAGLARDWPVHVRYIEMMPIGTGRRFSMTGEERLLAELEKRYGRCAPCTDRLGNGPAHYFSFPGFRGKIGFISAVSRRFCGGCNRIRLTAEGFLKPCLQYGTGEDLRRLLREDAGQEALREAVKRAVQKKPEGHRFGEEAGQEAETRTMSQIGG
jgi:cyclic pyranopterin phosphate synthase